MVRGEDIDRLYPVEEVLNVLDGLVPGDHPLLAEDVAHLFAAHAVPSVPAPRSDAVDVLAVGLHRDALREAVCIDHGYCKRIGCRLFDGYADVCGQR